MASWPPIDLIAFHISNRHLSLGPVLANLAQACGLVAFGQVDLDRSFPGKEGSIWVVLARNEDNLGVLMRPRQLQREGRKVASLWQALRAAGLTLPAAMVGGLASAFPPSWQPLVPQPRAGVWTDDYSNLLAVMSFW